MIDKKKVAAAIMVSSMCVIIIYALSPTQNLGMISLSQMFCHHSNTTITDEESQDAAMLIKTLTYYHTQTVPLRNVSRVFYTRVPKCATTTTGSLLRKLKFRNNFSFPVDLGTIKIDHKVLRRCISCKAEHGFHWETAVTEFMTNQTTPTMLSGHLHHIDFTLFMDRDFPVYFSMIRDPIDRLVSKYYYNQKVRKFIPHLDVPPDNVTYDECVERDMGCCTDPTAKGYFRIIPFFCGNQATCRHENDQALQIAKRNLLKDYAVVGLSEYYTESLQILETVLPQYFTGVTNLYREERTTENIARKKATINNSTITKMKPLLKMEYEFYHFVKQRFFTQYQTLFKKSLKY